MLLDQIITINKATEKVSLLFKCAFLALFLVIMLYLSMEMENKRAALSEKQAIQAPMKNTGGSLRAKQSISQGSAIFTASGSR